MKEYDLSFEKRRDYMLANWQDYNLVETEKEFIALLNVCEALNETIDNIHDVVINGGCCGISACDSWESEKEVVESLFYFSTFYTLNDFMGFLYEELKFAYDEDADGDNYGVGFFVDTYIRNTNHDCVIQETHDGYVVTIYV